MFSIILEKIIVLKLNKTMNLFKKAIDNNELKQFAIGENDYFILDRENDEHWILGSWLNYILPYTKDNDNDNVEKMFLSLLNNISFKENKTFDSLLYHTYSYFYLLSENRIKELIKKNIVIQIISNLEAYSNFLKTEKTSEYILFNQSIQLIKKRIEIVSKKN
jgi:hypothetical protein